MNATKRLQALLDEQASKADLKALNDALMDHFKGPKGLAAEVYREYADAPAGSVARQRLLSSVLDIFNKTSELDNSTTLLNDTSDDDLAAVAKELLKNEPDTTGEAGGGPAAGEEPAGGDQPAAG